MGIKENEEMKKCWRKDVAESELDRLIEGEKFAPSTPIKCYDCDGYDVECDFYETRRKRRIIKRNFIDLYIKILKA